MDTDRIDPMALPKVAPAAIAPSAEPAAASGSLVFRRLLESIESLARTPASEVQSADDLPQALRRAEDDYVAAMELRRQLEQAISGGR
jgi:hypothetical protein